MKTKRIPIHSVTDLITNSSTTIFTYSENSVGALEEMINELFKVLNVNKTCDEVFNVIILSDDYYVYSEYIANLKENEEEYPEGLTEETNISELFENVRTGKVEKPSWFNNAEEQQDGYNNYRPSTYLHLSAKDKEFEKLASLIYSFLYSTDHESTYEG